MMLRSVTAMLILRSPYVQRDDYENTNMVMYIEE